MRRTAFRLLLLGTVALALGACGGGEAPRPAEGWLLPVRTTEPPADANWAALLRGAVHFDAARRCVLFNGTAAVFPAGTVVLEDPLRLRLADGRIVHEGDIMEGSGGGARTVDWIPDVANADEAQRCLIAEDVGIQVFPQELTDVKVAKP